MREVTASSLIEIGPQGEILGGRQALEVNRTAIVIHGAIHRARPEVNTAIHAHTGAGIAVGCLPDGLLPLSQWALKFYGLTAFHDYDGAARMGGLGEAIERDLGQAVVMFMRNHGTLAVGRSAAEAFIRLYYLEQACKAQLMLCGVREALLMPSPEVCLRASQEQNMGTMQADGTFLPNGAREWAALMRILEREEPDYRE